MALKEDEEPCCQPEEHPFVVNADDNGKTTAKDDEEKSLAAKGQQVAATNQPSSARSWRQSGLVRTLCRLDLLGTVLVTGLTALVIGLLSKEEFTSGGQVVPFWKVGFTLGLTVGMVVIMTFDHPAFPSEVVLISGAAIFGLVGIIPTASVLAGLSDTTVTSVALLFPMAKAISDTGFLEMFVGWFLGTPRNHADAILRLCILVGPLSAIVNNTPVTAMMVPVLDNWCSRLGFDVAKLAMPLAFCAQLGGGLTLMGSPTNFAARKTYRQFGFEFGFLTLTDVAAILYAIGIVYFAVMAPFLLGKRREESKQMSMRERALSGDVNDGWFRVSFVVNPRGAFSREKVKVADAGFDRFKGVFGIKMVLREDMVIYANDLAECHNVRLKAGDVIIFRATAEGIVKLRQTPGISIMTEQDSRNLGRGRNRRRAFEVELPATSSLLDSPVDTTRLREEHGCALLAIRARHSREAVKLTKADCNPKLAKADSNPYIEVQFEDLIVPNERFEIQIESPRGIMGNNSEIIPSRSRWSVISDDDLVRNETSQVPNTTATSGTFQGFMLHGGDVLLLEADPAQVGTAPWARDFGIVRAMANSSPPKLGRKRDTCRSIGAIMGAVLAIGLFVASSQMQEFERFTLTSTLIMLVLFLLATRTMRVENVYSALNGPVLLTMVGAFPLGEAIQAVGLDTWAGTSLVDLFAPMGSIGSFIAIYAVSAGLSNLISNIAVIAMVAPVSVQIAQVQGIDLKYMVICTTLATASVFTFPIGHQTNLMVVPLGKYGWGDFLKFGGLFQLLHGLACCLVCWALS